MNLLGFAKPRPVAVRRDARPAAVPIFADVAPAMLRFWLDQHLAASEALRSGRLEEVHLYRPELRREVVYTASQLRAIEQQIAGFELALAPTAVEVSPAVAAVFRDLSERKFA